MSDSQGGGQAAAIFDLDDTLIDGDSDYLWGEFLCDLGVVDATTHRRDNARFLADYRAGTLDLDVFHAFQLAPLVQFPLTTLHEWRRRFVAEVIAPRVYEGGLALLGEHREAARLVIIATATNRFITSPIAEMLGVGELLATEPEMLDGRYTGKIEGQPCSGAGKLAHVRDWANRSGADLGQSWFYSDSSNDLPLLGQVGQPVATNPDPQLRTVAAERGWQVLDL